jgi:galactokinase
VTPDEWLGRVDASGASGTARRDAEAVLAQVVRSDLFAAGRDIAVARAPGRLDVMGGIADYSGSLVLEWPLADATVVAAQKNIAAQKNVVGRVLSDPPDQPTITIVSGHRVARVPLSALLSLEYEAAREWFAQEPAQHWSAYVAGAFIVLARELKIEFSSGARLLVMSTVPEGKGISSSAALEVAAMTAICAAYGVSVEPRQLALLCQKVENLIAGAPCGVMDQMTAALGESGHLLALLCQPAEVCGRLALPPGLGLWGIDSGIRHAVAGAEYGTVRTAASMGHRILEQLTGRRFDYLANVSPTEFSTLAALLPERVTGRQFLEHYELVSHETARVDPERVYPVRVATAHPIYEHARVRAFAERLSSYQDSDADREQLGALMLESHSSYSACGLGSEGTDAIVDLVRRAGSHSGMYGAKITGGGSGGTVAILGRPDAGTVVHDIAEQYRLASGRAARVFSGSSAGAAACGVCDLRR